MSFHPSMGPHPPQFRSVGITCLLPGLRWNGVVPPGLLDSTALPVLCMLLGRGVRRDCTDRSGLQWIASQSRTPTMPWAQLRLAGEPGTAQAADADSQLLCADPVSICFVRDALLLLGPRSVALRQEEADALCAMLNAEFGDFGRFHAATPERWYLQTSRPVARFQPLEDAVGRPVAYFPPEGEHAADWNRVANEIQTALYAHPVNQARQAAGRPLANALWFWGETPAEAFIGKTGLSHIVSADPIFRGLAARTGMTPVTPAQAASGMPGSILWHDARLEQAAQDGDPIVWRQALEALEQEVVAPLYQTWKTGRLISLRLIAPADRGGFEITLGAGSHWAFWRRALDTQRLSALLLGSR